MPPGYVAASAQLELERGTVVGVTIVYRHRESDLAGGALLLHVEPGRHLPPAGASDQYGLDVDGIAVRWTPERSVLEWATDGTYVSLSGALPLPTLLGVVEGIVAT
jgi:hypothetical protein